MGTFSDKIDEAHPFAWWFAFHLEGSGHFIAEEKPEATLGYLSDFLK